MAQELATIKDSHVDSIYIHFPDKSLMRSLVPLFILYTKFKAPATTCLA